MPAATIGQTAPDFALPSHTGETVELRALRGRPVVVFFFPKAFTPACSMEACRFRDAADSFGGFDALAGASAESSGHDPAVVLGVSSDSVERLATFAKSFSLPFKLLSDANGRVREAWGVPRTLGLFPGRVTYVLDAHGVVRQIVRSQLRPSLHARAAAKALADLRASAAGER